MSPFESIPSLSIDACGVLSQLRQLNPNKAQGPDELSPQLLKLVAEELAPALTIIFQQSYDLSSTPKDWNSAIVTPIYKKGLNLIHLTIDQCHLHVYAARLWNI